MSEDGRRPGGLTALAVLNFVWAGLLSLALLAAVAAIGAVSRLETKEAVEFKAELKNPGLLWANLLLLAVTIALLIASGVGYLGLKRFLGRTLGNAYGVIGLATSALGVVIGGFDIGTIIFLVYPLLTVVLLNTTFKEDFVR